MMFVDISPKPFTIHEILKWSRNLAKVLNLMHYSNCFVKDVRQLRTENSFDVELLFVNSSTDIKENIKQFGCLLKIQILNVTIKKKRFTK